MKKTGYTLLPSTLALAISAGIFSHGVGADQLEERLDSVEQRLEYTEQRLRAQDETILNQQEANPISLSGLVEVELASTSNSKDLTAATVELGIGAAISESVGAEVLLKYEDGATTDGTMVVDTAIITLAPQDSMMSFLFGKTGVPFGVYDTHLVSDPITKDLGDTSDNGVFQADFGLPAVGISAYAYNGDADGKINDFGVNFALASEDLGLGLNLGLINRFQNEDINGTAVSASYQTGPFSIIAEHIRANEALANSSKPSATHLEGAYGTVFGDKPTTFAIGLGSSSEAQSAGLDKKRTSAAVTVGILQNTSLGLELKSAKDYSNATTNTITGKIGVEF